MHVMSCLTSLVAAGAADGATVGEIGCAAGEGCSAVVSGSSVGCTEGGAGGPVSGPIAAGVSATSVGVFMLLGVGDSIIGCPTTEGPCLGSTSAGDTTATGVRTILVCAGASDTADGVSEVSTGITLGGSYDRGAAAMTPTGNDRVEISHTCAW